MWPLCIPSGQIEMERADRCVLELFTLLNSSKAKIVAFCGNPDNSWPANSLVDYYWRHSADFVRHVEAIRTESNVVNRLDGIRESIFAHFERGGVGESWWKVHASWVFVAMKIGGHGVMAWACDKVVSSSKKYEVQCGRWLCSLMAVACHVKRW